MPARGDQLVAEQSELLLHRISVVLGMSSSSCVVLRAAWASTRWESEEPVRQGWCMQVEEAPKLAWLADTVAAQEPVMVVLNSHTPCLLRWQSLSSHSRPRGQAKQAALRQSGPAGCGAGGVLSMKGGRRAS